MGAVVPDEPLEIAEIIVRDTATATDDLSAIAPDVRPDLSQGAAAALLAKYRRHGAALAIETIDGKPALAIEVPATFSPAKSERAFALLEADGLAIYRALEIESGAASSHGGELVI